MRQRVRREDPQIAAAKLAGNPGLSVRSRVEELGRPDRLVAGDPEEAFRSALDLAYESLSPAQRRAFRHVGLLPGRDFTPEVLAKQGEWHAAQMRDGKATCIDCHKGVAHAAPGG